MTGLGLAAVGAAAGFLGSVLGLGGGVVIVPGLVFLFDLPLRSAVAVSLVGITATSLAGAAVYLDRGRVDLPLALRLESAAVAGAVTGALTAHLFPETGLYLAFAAAVLYTAVAMLRDAPEAPAVGPTPSRSGPGRRRMAAGVAASGGAGLASALLGIGGGFVKVPILHLLLRTPLQVATATSVLMVGMTAAASGWIYWMRGDLSVTVAAPVALGVLVGGTLGSRVSGRVPDRVVRVGLAVVLLYVTARMAWTGVTGP